MKQLISIGLFGLAICLLTFAVKAQSKAEKGTIQIYLAYSQLNNELPIIKASTKTKKDQKFVPVEGVEVNLFFKEETSTNFMGRVKTDIHGNSFLSVPVRFKPQLDSSSSLKFIATVTQNPHFENQSTELEITKAKIELTLDAGDSTRTIHAKVLAFHPDSGWVAQPETEVKLIVRRMLSDLNATEEESYTTDANGEVAGDYNLTNIPGDAQGNILVGAKLDENELYGTVIAAKSVKWGTQLLPDNSFAKRSLWATRDKTPIWLLVFPNLIIVCVWGIIFYLIYQIIKLKKLGKA